MERRKLEETLSRENYGKHKGLKNRLLTLFFIAIAISSTVFCLTIIREIKPIDPVATQEKIKFIFLVIFAVAAGLLSLFMISNFVIYKEIWKEALSKPSAKEKQDEIKEQDDAKHKHQKDKSGRWLYFAVPGLILLCLCWPFLVSTLAPHTPGYAEGEACAEISEANITPSETKSTSYEKFGQMGDMFGALNAFISGLAFIFFYRSLQLQRVDIKNQREQYQADSERNEIERLQFKQQYDLQKEQIASERENNVLNQLNNTFFRKLEILHHKYDIVTYTPSTTAQAASSSSGVTAWGKIHEETNKLLGDTTKITASAFTRKITKNISSYMAIYAWFMIFCDIMEDIINIKKAKRRMIADSHLRTLFNSLSGTEKEFICLCFAFSSNSKQNSIFSFLEQRKLLDYNLRNLSTNFCCAENNQRFVEYLKKLLPR